MRATLKLTKAELQNLFYSPIAWLIIIAFFIQSGLVFFKFLGDLSRFQEIYGSVASGVTDQIFTSYRRLFPSVLSYIHLYIPLLTMGLMSKEFSSGSIKLLYSSPISNWQIIIGKYLSMLVYALILAGVLLFFSIIAYFAVETLDMKLVLSGILGIFLLICTYAAIGLFMSSLTSYQIVAAIFTFIILTLLSMVGSWGQDIEFVREITYWLSINGRAFNFIDGIIGSEDVIYFILVIGLFLSLSVIRLTANRQKASFRTVSMKYLGVVSFVIIVGFLTSRPIFRFYYDATYNQRNSITEESKAILKQVKGKLKVTTYVNVLGARASLVTPQKIVADRARFEQYLRFKPRMDFDYIHYYRRIPTSLDTMRTELEEAQFNIRGGNYSVKKLKSWQDLSEEARMDLRDEYTSLVRILEDENGNKSVLRTYTGIVPHPGEREITSALQSLVMELPKVAYLQGHREREVDFVGDRTMYHVFSGKYEKNSLLNNGFDFVNLTLDKPVPDDVDILVIAEPRDLFSELNHNYLMQYIERGGNLFIIANSERQDVINTLINPLGVSYMPGILVQESKTQSPDIVGTVSEPDNGILSLGMALYGSSYFTYSDTLAFDYIPLMRTRKDGNVWNELQTTDFVDEDLSCDAKQGEYFGEFLTSLALKREINGKVQKIVMLADADCLAGQRAAGDPAYSYIHQVFYWLSDGVAPIQLHRKGLIDGKMLTTESNAKMLKNIFLWGFAVLMTLFVIVLLFRRMAK